MPQLFGALIALIGLVTLLSSLLVRGEARTVLRRIAIGVVICGLLLFAPRIIIESVSEDRMSLITFCALSLVAGLVVLIAGLIARTRPQPAVAGLGTAGVVLGAIAMTVGVLAFVVPVVLFLAFEHG